MAYIEKAVQEEEKAGSGVTKEMIIKGCCPSAYGFSNEEDCKNKACADCWNREIPDTNKSVLLTMNKETELNIDKKIKEQEEKSYNQGLNDAWELVRKLYDMKCEELGKIFCISDSFYEIIRDFTPQEAIAKLKAYEDSKIEVGDVVTFTHTDTKYVVLAIHGEEKVYCYNGYKESPMQIGSVKDLEKTGEYIEIPPILSIKGEYNDRTGSNRNFRKTECAYKTST